MNNLIIMLKYIIDRNKKDLFPEGYNKKYWKFIKYIETDTICYGTLKDGNRN